MANSVNTMSKMWRLDSSDIITTIPICIRMVYMKCTAKADEAIFYTLPGSKAADSDGIFTNLTVGATQITDADVGAAWGSALQNDWVRVSQSTSGATDNDGWYWLSATNTSSLFQVQNASTAPGATGSNLSARIQIYTPVECMAIASDTVQATQASIHHPTLDWGDKGRWFDNLSFYEATGTDLDIRLYIK